MLVTLFAATKWVQENATPLVQKLVIRLKIAALALFVLNAVPFVTQQIQHAIYPQLEPYKVTWRDDEAFYYAGGCALASSAPVMREADGIRQRVAGAMNSIDIPSNRYEQKSSKLDIKSNILYDTKAKIQTGPAVPQWKWRAVSFGWR